jgi:hypothetical protein
MRSIRHPDTLPTDIGADDNTAERSSMIFQRGERVVLVRDLTAPHHLWAGTLGTVLGAWPEDEGVLVRVAFDGNLLQGGLNVAGHDLRLVPTTLGDPLAGLPPAALADVA